MRGLKPPQKRPRSITALSADLQRLRPPVANQVTGVGTVGQLAKWVGANQLGDGGVGGGGGGSVPGIYWAPPAVPNARDEEFDGDMSAWTQWAGTTFLGGVDPTANFSTANHFRADCNVRPSWLRLQPSSAGQMHCYRKSIAVLPQNFVMIVRAAIIFKDVGYGTNHAVLGVQLFDSTGPDFAIVYANQPSGTAPRVGSRVNAGTLNQNTFLSPDLDIGPMQWPLYALQRAGQVWTAWAGSDSGSWQPLSPIDAGAGTMGNLDSLTVLVGNDTSSSNVMCLDFIRFLETSKWPL